eukprot:jgi/Astpho2/6807/Aster-x1399
MAEGDAPDGPEGGKDSEASQDAAHTADASTGPGTPAADSEPAPLREDQIQNAMAFLSHPKVQGSTADAKRSFLERKGLTQAEIDEAVRRVPPQTATAPQAPSAQAAGARPTKPFPTGTAVHPLQPAQQHQSQLQPQQQQLPQQGVNWTQIVLGASVLATAAYGLKQLTAPTLSSWWARWRGRPTAAEEAAAQKAEEAAHAKALAEAIKAQTNELHTSVTSMKEMLQNIDRSSRQAAGGGQHQSPSLSLGELRNELRTFAATLNEFGSPEPAQVPGLPPAASGNTEAAIDLQRELDSIKQMLAQVTAQGGASPATGHSAKGYESGSGEQHATEAALSGGLGTVTKQLPFTPASRHTASAVATPHQGSSATGDERRQDGQTSGGQTLPAINTRVSLPQDDQPDKEEGSLPTKQELSPPAEAPHPASYMQIMDMLKKGETPPGIRTDIKDQPPNPTRPITEPKLKPRVKPWEQVQLANGGAGSSRSSRHSAEDVVAGGKENQAAEGQPRSLSGTWQPPPAPKPSLNLGARSKSNASTSS